MRLTPDAPAATHPRTLCTRPDPTPLNAERDVATARRRLRLVLAGVLLFIGCDGDPTNPDPACAEARPLPLGQTLAESLDAQDPMLDGSRIDYYSVFPASAGTLTVEMAAEVPSGGGGVDPFLYLWTEELGDPEEHAYDPSPEDPLLRVARLTWPVTPGCYRIGASWWPAAAPGSYTIRADLDPAP